MKHRQLGVSLMGLIMALFVVVIVGIFSLKLIPPFIEYGKAKTAIVAIASMAFLAARYSRNEGISLKLKSASTMTMNRMKIRPIRLRPRCARFIFLAPRQWNGPNLPRSLRFSHMKNALPTMFSSGTNPQTRLSLELSRLSPITK